MCLKEAINTLVVRGLQDEALIYKLYWRPSAALLSRSLPLFLSLCIESLKLIALWNKQNKNIVEVVV